MVSRVDFNQEGFGVPEVNPRSILVSRGARAMMSVSTDCTAMYATSSRNRCQNRGGFSNLRFWPAINEALGLPSTICMYQAGWLIMTLFVRCSGPDGLVEFNALPVS